MIKIQTLLNRFRKLRELKKTLVRGASTVSSIDRKSLQRAEKTFHKILKFLLSIPKKKIISYYNKSELRE